MLTRNLSAHMVRKKYKTFVLRSSGVKAASKIESFQEAFDNQFFSGPTQGILYLLYSKDRLYYIGKSSQQGWRRMLRHEKNNHRNNWDKFVLLGVKKKYLTTLESLLIAVANPIGNRARTRIPVKMS